MRTDQRKVVASPDISVRQALQQMDESGRRLLMLVSDRKLLGVVSDGDVRRWILGNGDLTAPVERIANHHPVVLFDGEFAPDDARQIMVNKRIEAIPVVNRNGVLVSVVYWFDVEDGVVRPQQQFDLPVVIMAGGLGTRLAPYTHVLPKPLIPIGEKTIAERIIDRFLRYGCTHFLMSVNHRANMIRAFFSEESRDYDVSFFQETEPRGTIGSLSLVTDRLHTTFFVTNCDIIVNTDYEAILRFHRDNGFCLTTVAASKNVAVPYGVLETDAHGCLQNVREKPSSDFLVNTGLYLLEPAVLALIPSAGVYHITDLMNACRMKGLRVGVYPVSERAWLDMGQIDEMKRMIEYFGYEGTTARDVNPH